jgi:hypothetical protein
MRAWPWFMSRLACAPMTRHARRDQPMGHRHPGRPALHPHQACRRQPPQRRHSVRKIAFTANTIVEATLGMLPDKRGSPARSPPSSALNPASTSWPRSTGRRTPMTPNACGSSWTNRASWDFLFCFRYIAHQGRGRPAWAHRSTRQAPAHPADRSPDLPRPDKVSAAPGPE